MSDTNKQNMDFKTTTKDEQLAYLRPLIDYGFKMLQAGTLKKNVVRHWINKGMSNDAAKNLAELSEVQMEHFTHYAIK